MPNIIQTTLSVEETYDLKGSVRNRRVSEKEYLSKEGNVTLKDLNFNEKCFDRGYGMQLDAFYTKILQQQLALDSTLLRELDIMDYSLAGVNRRLSLV